MKHRHMPIKTPSEEPSSAAPRGVGPKGNMAPQKTFLYMLILYLDISFAQRDCTGVDCPEIHRCIETTLESGACCPTCSKRGCTCEGYQYYDCVQAGFRRGKVPEGESYFVDFGSTECSCPRGGGNISCRFIPCPEIPANCIDVSQPEDGCPQCAKIGCVHVSEAQGEALQKGQTSHGKTTASHRPQPASTERSIRHNSERSNSTRAHKTSRNAAKHQKQSQNGQSVRKEQEERPHPAIQFSPTTKPPVRMRDFGQQPKRLAQTLLNSQDAEVSSDELLRSCCETGEKWASVRGHCSSMEPPTRDRHSICWTSQQQCCLGSLREQQCLSGVKAATAGASCERDGADECGSNSFKECCGCCALGLQFRAEALSCDAHPSLGFHCRHIFMTCCEEEEGAGGPSAWHPVRDRPASAPTSPPQRVSDSPAFPKEAFSLGQEVENAVESPVEVEDMDECLIYEGSICHHTCVNTPGSFRCQCFPGYTLQEDAVTCAKETPEDQNRLKEDDKEEPTLPPPAPPTEHPAPNPCQENNPCEQQCTPVGRWPQCSCFPGFALATNGLSCEDINECLSGLVCHLNERCVNTAGSYSCQRVLTCPPGYHIQQDMCEDVNECAQSSHSCGPDFECVNTLGSFRCNPRPRCPRGFSQDQQGHCADVDECVLSQPCGLGFNCINTAGSYVCNRKIICSRGYRSSPDGSRCVDVDECEGGLHRCGEGQLCHNMAGSYRCECQTGYQYDSFGKTCVDVNECWRYPGRLCAQTCDNTPGSYRCSCTAGFRLSGDGNNCEDVNECLSSPCGQECSNLYGSYQCYCNQGYFLREDGHSCDDIDECSQSIGHLCTYKCVNVAGSYQCACPQHGYTMSPNGRSCRDIDECTSGTHNCSLSETCYNIQGGHRCLSFDCPPNYRRASDTRCERMSCPNFLDCQSSPLRITYYYLSFQSNILIPAQIFRIGPSPAYSGDNVIVSITQGNDDNYFSTRKLNTYTGAVYLHRQLEGPRDFLVTVEMKLWRQGTFTTFQARIYVFITGTLL
uniref:Fibulin 2 n=1 Tax=Knipowitschia caucasica TaxID=637954 RepID=A0AAV2M0K3_KNICA